MKWPAPLPSRLRGPATLAATALAAAAALIHAGQVAREEGLAQRQQAASRHSHSADELRRIEQGQEAIRQQAGLFRSWQARGLIGPPRPREWGEQFQNLQREMRLPALSYEFLPPAPGTKEGDFSFHAVALKLHLDLLHEEDLLHFLDRLENSARALVLVRSCRLSRLPPMPVRPGATPAALGADCEMDWATAYGPQGRQS